MKRAIVVDLDGTLVDTNTFSRFTLALMRKPKMTMSVAITALGRKMRLYSHAEAKQRILRLADARTNSRFIDHFVEQTVQNHLRDTVYSLALREQKKGALIILATAAPEMYAAVIARYTGLDGFIATPTGGAENKGKVKAQRVKQWLEENDATLGAVITDHADDLPLMQLAADNEAGIWLVNPSERTRELAGHLDPHII